MRKIKLSGREASVLRSIDFSTGTLGAEIHERTRIATEDLIDIVNGLLDAGFAQSEPALDRVVAEAFNTTLFEVNSSYALDLREAIKRRS